MNQSPLIISPIFDSSIMKTNPEKWDSVIEDWENKNYSNVLKGIIEYVDASILSKAKNSDFTDFSIPHGSAVVNIKIENDEFTVNAPFLNLPEKNTIPLLRQVAQINFHPLVLADIILEGNQLSFKYSCSLSLCEPWKIYSVLYEICYNADIYDDEFIKKFGATRIQEPIVTPYPQAKLDEIWDILQKFVNESFEYIKFFQDKRWDGYTWDAIMHVLYKIEFALGPQGQFRNELEKTISMMLDQDASLNELNIKGIKYLESLKNYKRTDFDKDTYIVETFIPYKTYLTLENLRSHSEEGWKRAQGEINSNNYQGATYSLLYTILKNFYNHSIPAEYSTILRNGLINSSNKPWKDAAQILMNTMNSIMQDSKKAAPVDNAGGWGA
jgi:hypothetical protein